MFDLNFTEKERQKIINRMPTVSKCTKIDGMDAKQCQKCNELKQCREELEEYLYGINPKD